MATRNPEREALLAALHTAMRAFTNQVTFYSEAVAATVGIHSTDLDCLSVIDMEGALTAGALADVTGLTSGAITGVVDRLERAGFVRRDADPTDRRRVVVRTVPDALGPVGAAFVPMIAATSAMAERYDDSELATITDYVTRATPMLREETLRLRAGAESDDQPVDDVAIRGSDARDATIRFVNGAVRLDVTAAHGRADLFGARFRGGAPTTRVDGDTVVVQYRRSPFAHFRTGGSIVLDAERRWSVEVAGGLAHSTLDLRDTTVRSVDVVGGVASVDLHLPRPDGTTTVSVKGGMSAVTITRPAGVAARVRIKGGASNLVVDEQRFAAIGGRVDLRSSEPGGGDQLDVVVVGGVRSLSVVTTTPPRG